MGDGAHVSRAVASNNLRKWPSKRKSKNVCHEFYSVENRLENIITDHLPAAPTRIPCLVMWLQVQRRVGAHLHIFEPDPGFLEVSRKCLLGSMGVLGEANNSSAVILSSFRRITLQTGGITGTRGRIPRTARTRSSALRTRVGVGFRARR